jgi:protein phosphatase
MIRVHAITDCGVSRDHNEDAVFVAAPARAGFGALLVVADGLGGHAAGEVASGVAVDHFRDFAESQPDADKNSPESILNRVIHNIHGDIKRIAGNDPLKRGMGTTIVVAVVLENMLYTAWAGDSRAYLVRNNAARRITEDHSVVAELVRNGVITEEQARKHSRRHVITRCLGQSEISVQNAIATAALAPGDRVLLCSDGLTAHLDDADIARIISESAGPESACEALVSTANERGGSDNITAAVAFYEL